MQNGLVKFPDDEKLSSGETNPYVFLGNEAFALKVFMMKHLHQQGLIRERHRHYRHSTAQKISKNLF